MSSKVPEIMPVGVERVSPGAKLSEVARLMFDKGYRRRAGQVGQ